MENELQKLNEYAKMGANLPKNEFVKLAMEIVRKGTLTEANNVISIMNNLASIPELEYFYQQGVEKIKGIRRSHLNYDMLNNGLINFKNSFDEIALIGGCYDKIQDPYFLYQANKLIAKHPILAKYTKIRKTQKEMEEEKENLMSEYNNYQKQYYDVFNRLNRYLSGGIYNIGISRKFDEELLNLQVKTQKYRSVLGEEQYKQILNQIATEQSNLKSLTNELEEEEIIWSR